MTPRPDTGTFVASVVLVTGGAGFVGSNLVRWLLAERPTLRIVTLDLLTYAGHVENLADVHARHGADGDGRHFFVHGDVRDTALAATLLAGGGRDTRDGRQLPRPDALLHLAAETHVDRSVIDPVACVSTNIGGSLTLLEAVRAHLAGAPRPFRVVHVSTDEVYGSLAEGAPPFTEEHPLAPNSPYAASKAGADCLARAYRETFDLPVLVVRGSNSYGPYQFPEKLIPLMVTRALDGEPLPVYGDGFGSRDWLHVHDFCAAIWAVCERGVLTDGVYNVGGGAERRNLDVVRAILARLGRPDSLIRHVRDRPGHDRRYALDSSRARARLGWAPSRTFEPSLAEVVDWYVTHRSWWRQMRTDAHRADTLYFPGASP